MSQSTLTLDEAVEALKLDVSVDEARQDIKDGLLTTATHSDEVVWIGDWVRWMRYRTALDRFPPEKKGEFRQAMLDRLGGVA